MASDVMMTLGGFPFQISTAAYDELQRRSAWRWAKQDRIGTMPALQFTGKDSDEITLRGTILPHWRGGLTQIPRMRALGDRGEPLELVSGLGEAMGLWVMETLSETGTQHAERGVPLVIKFDLRISYYGQ